MSSKVNTSVIHCSLLPVKLNSTARKDLLNFLYSNIAQKAVLIEVFVVAENSYIDLILILRKPRER